MMDQIVERRRYAFRGLVSILSACEAHRDLLQPDRIACCFVAMPDEPPHAVPTMLGTCYWCHHARQAVPVSEEMPS